MSDNPQVQTMIWTKSPLTSPFLQDFQTWFAWNPAGWQRDWDQARWTGQGLLNETYHSLCVKFKIEFSEYFQLYVLRKRGGVLEQCVRETRTIEDTYPPPPLERRVKTKLQLEPQQQVKKTKTVLRELNRLDILVVFNVPVPSLPSIAWWC